jgi:hypothetical protein
VEEADAALAWLDAYDEAHREASDQLKKGR